MAHYDMLVIGSGPAGQKAAIQAAKVGKKVGIIERKKVVGGICINSGTIPSKSLREAVLFLSGFRQRSLYGASYRVKKDITFEDLAQRCDHVVKAEQEVIQNQLIRNSVDFIVGTASFLDPHRLQIKQDSEIQRTHGGLHRHRRRHRAGPAGEYPLRRRLDHRQRWSAIVETAAEVIDHRRRRRHRLRVCLHPGDALEFPSCWSRKRPRLLEFVDSEIIESLQYQMRNIGITLRLNEEVVGVTKAATNVVALQLKSGKQIRSPLLVYSAGRVGATKSLGLEKIGVEADERGRLKVNENFQTTEPYLRGRRRGRFSRPWRQPRCSKAATPPAMLSA